MSYWSTRHYCTILRTSPHFLLCPVVLYADSNPYSISNHGNVVKLVSCRISTMTWLGSQQFSYTVKTDDHGARTYCHSVNFFIRCLCSGQHTNTYTIQTTNKSKYKCQPLSSSHTYAYPTHTKSVPDFRSLAHLATPGDNNTHTNRRHDRVIPCTPRAAASSLTLPSQAPA